MDPHIDDVFESICFKAKSFEVRDEFLAPLRRAEVLPGDQWLCLAELFLTATYDAFETSWTRTRQKMSSALASWWTPDRIEQLDSRATVLVERHDASSWGQGVGMVLAGVWNGSLRVT
jgi:hypothetical protein